jgi:Tol biopolymer transport system component
MRYYTEPVAWSPDGREIVFSAASELETDWVEMLYVLNFETGQVRKLEPFWPGINPGGAALLEHPAWSMDGGSILFVQPSGPEQFIHRMDVKTQAASYLTTGMYPIWLDGGRAIASLHLYMTENYKTTGYGDIYLYNLDNGSESKLTKDIEVDFITASPNGTQIAYGRKENKHFPIYTMDSDGSNSRRVVLDAGIFSWAPDGNWLWYGMDCHIYRVSVDSLEKQLIHLPQGYCYWYAALQPLNNQ